MTTNGINRDKHSGFVEIPNGHGQVDRSSALVVGFQIPDVASHGPVMKTPGSLIVRCSWFTARAENCAAMEQVPRHDAAESL